MKKVFFVFLALVAFASCKKDDLPNSPSSGEKEVVRLSLSGDLGEARGLILTPKEQGGKVKIEVKSGDRKLRADYLIVNSTGQYASGEIDLKVDADGGYRYLLSWWCTTKGELTRENRFCNS